MDSKNPKTEHRYFTLFLLNKPLRVGNGMSTALFMGCLLAALFVTLLSGKFLAGGIVTIFVFAINSYLRKQHTKNKIPDFIRAIILKTKSPNYVSDDGKTYKKLIDGSN